jgi:hypothetical protein
MYSLGLPWFMLVKEIVKENWRFGVLRIENGELLTHGLSEGCGALETSSEN